MLFLIVDKVGRWNNFFDYSINFNLIATKIKRPSPIAESENMPKYERKFHPGSISTSGFKVFASVYIEDSSYHTKLSQNSVDIETRAGEAYFNWVSTQFLQACFEKSYYQKWRVCLKLDRGRCCHFRNTSWDSKTFRECF